ncbi:MAG: Glu-tRNA(Gln) amidotransferase subunit GatE [Candidatus Diapherotrites archaeon]|nr:Glu-tRNA(Gln) amidotransferase subunit GatE [Candidatus Diapherotrites archaeon]
MDYEKMGFRSGLELHVQLDTATKLFCECPTHRSQDFPFKIRRKLRAVAGELGEIDLAARHEQARDITFVYCYNPATSCLVETDSEPPHPMNEEALETTLQVCKMIGADVIGEIHVMRKTVVDGSNTTGFQRTSLVGRGGRIDTSLGPVRMVNTQLEEDAATVVDRKPGEVWYRLDRLGIPLIELSTEPDIKSPEHVYETALAIGSLLRATRKVKRGIGTIRQDINISIKGGARVEIKGAQDLKMFPEIARREVARQQVLIEVAEELEKRKAKVGKIIDVTNLFKNTKCKFIRGKTVLALPLIGFEGILGKEVQPNRRVGTELSDHAKKAGVGGIIHSDEDMRNYQIEKDIIVNLKLEGEAFVLVAADEKRAKNALKLVAARANQLIVGVPSEVRRALPDGNSEFLRPMPGAARLYIETDIPPVVVEQKRLDAIPLPELPGATLARLKKLMSNDLAEKLASSNNLILFDHLKWKHPEIVAHVLEDTLTELRREGIDVDMLPDQKLIEMFMLYDKGAFAKEGFPEIIRAIVFNPTRTVVDIVEDNFSKMNEKQVRKAVKKIVAKNKGALGDPRAFQKIMGEVMKELRGKADGQLIARAVKESI